MKICFIHHYLSKHPSIHHGELRFDSQECAGFMYSIPVYWAYVQIITHPHTIWISILSPLCSCMSETTEWCYVPSHALLLYSAHYAKGKRLLW